MKSESADVIVTTVRVRPETWQMLRQLAEARSLAEGGRPSASAVIETLIVAESKRLAELNA